MMVFEMLVVLYVKRTAANPKRTTKEPIMVSHIIDLAQQCTEIVKKIANPMAIPKHITSTLNELKKTNLLSSLAASVTF